MGCPGRISAAGSNRALQPELRVRLSVSIPGRQLLMQAWLLILYTRATSSARASRGAVRRYADPARAPGLVGRGPSYGVCVAPFSLR
jgi:hypothetical protein